MPSTPPDDRPAGDAPASFLGRRTKGLSNYLWVALAVTLVLGFIPRGVRQTILSNTNKAEDWLPPSYAESADLAWFREHFAGEAFVLISWDGCTLGETERLRLLEQKLGKVTDEQGWSWYPRVRSGPSTIEDLVTGPAGLSRSAAITRLEGALVGPPQRDAAGESLGDATRVTCVQVYLDDRLTDSNLLMRKAVERVRDIAHGECGVALDAIHMGGPPVDNITIDIEGERTLFRLAGLAAIVGATLAYLCFRSLSLTAMVFWAAVVSAGMSMAVVYYYGLFEVFALGKAAARLGTADAILMSMPAVVYVLSLSGAIHLVNYYRDERLAHGERGAAERAVRVAWGPCVLAALTTAVGLGSLGASDILPIQKFGIFSAIGVTIAVGLLFAILPVLLHRFPPTDEVVRGRKRDDRPTGRAPKRQAWYTPIARFVTTRHGLTAAVVLSTMAFVAAGLPQIRTSVQLLNLLDESCDLITDYTWLEEHLGNLVPMEVIVALDEDQLRRPDELAIDETVQAGGEPRYRMTMYERSLLARTLQSEIESLEPISRALSAATFSAEPQDDGGSAGFGSGVAFTTSELLEDSRESLAEYLRLERDEAGQPTGRELWRVSARVTALGNVDYGRFVESLREKVEPVLDAYRLRDQIVVSLSGLDKPIGEANVCLLTGGEEDIDAESAAVEERLAPLLRESSGVGRRVTAYPIEKYLAADEVTRARLRERIARYDAVFAVHEGAAKPLLDEAGDAIDVEVLSLEAAADTPLPATEAMAVYSGVVPVVYKTQRELLVSLRQSIGMATVLIAGVMVVVLRSPAAGLASMIPNVFPIVMVFGALGWLGIKVDIGIMMTASVALGVAVDDTLHFVTWFGRGIREGLDRRSATLQAFDRCATAMAQTTLIAGLGLAVFAVSTFTPTQEFGCLMVVMLGTALVGDLILLPALLCGPLGRFFAPGAPATPDGSPRPESVVAPAPAPVAEPEPVEIEEAPAEPVAEERPADPPATAAEEPLSPTNAALRSKLQRLRRNQTTGSGD